VTRLSVPFAVALTIVALNPASAEDAACKKPEAALGVSRIVEIDTKTGALFGEYTKLEKEPRFLGPKEVVLTFDDGPLPKFTKPILDALDEYCTKAVFFNVGEMALAYPDTVKEVLARGHTVGTHTWSHPMNLRALGLDKAKDQIERGFAAVALAAGDKPIAPFFRFPGLSDSGPLLAYLQERGIAAFTVDVVSNDSYIGSAQSLESRTLAQVEKQNGGIILFHDIKASTAKALPTILGELKKRGYKVVLLRPKAPYTPLPALTTELTEKRAKAAEKDPPKKVLVPFYEAVQLTTLDTVSTPAVNELAPAARERTHEGGTPATASKPVDTEEKATKPTRHYHKHYTRRHRSVASTD
jgi:peptidoglycan/xylan/chitin deacetylase (PgdA/CDA1 family)